MMLYALVAILVIRNFIFKNVRVDGVSMEPTLQHGNGLIACRFLYLFAEPSQFDVVIFLEPQQNQHLIKRVIGIPGDIVDIQDGSVYINGEKLEEDYCKEQTIQKGDISYPVIVPENHYFVLGDNRNESLDSRFHRVGFVPKDKIYGKAAVRFLPLNKISFI